MKITTVTLTVTELQQALRDYVKKHASAQPDMVLVDNGYGKDVLEIPLAPGAVVRGTNFNRQTDPE